jgi:Aerotolerance regulator N-terminal
MQFIYPSFLFALSAIAIPIIIHLFNFRKFKRVYFTNVKFLKEIKHETQSKSQLKHLLVLLCRILAIIFLVLAFAQPYIPLSKSSSINGDWAVSIFIDNSFSMDAQGKNGSLLEQAKKTAAEIVSAYKPADRFQLLTNDFEGKQQRLLTKEEFLEALQEVKSSAAVKSAAQILSRQADLLNQSESKSKRSYLVSDFQKSNYNLAEIKVDSTFDVVLIPLESSLKNNLFIDSCWFETPSRQLNKVEVLNVRVKNVSEQAIENVPIKLVVNSQQKALASISLEANASSTVQLTFTSKQIGIQQAQLQLIDYPVTFDDAYYFSFEVAKQIQVLSINQEVENNAITTLFKNDSAFLLQNSSIKNIDYTRLSTQNLIVLNELASIPSGLGQELKRFVENGGSLLVFPGTEIDLTSYQNFLSTLRANYYTAIDTADTRVEKLNLNHPIYSDIFDKKKKISENMDLPKVLSHYTLNSTSRSTIESLMRMQNGAVFLAEQNFLKGRIYLSAVPLSGDFSNFTKHALFVPTLYKIALYSLSDQKTNYLIGQEDAISLKAAALGKDEVYHLKSNSGNFDIVPDHKMVDNGITLLLHNQIKVADTYLLTSGKDSLVGLGFNYDRLESNLTCFDKDALEAQISAPGFANYSLLSINNQSIGTALKELNQGIKYWKAFILLALLFLALEVILIRFWK